MIGARAGPHLAGERAARHDGHDLAGRSRYRHQRAALAETPEDISAEVVCGLEDLYRRHLPLLEGAVQAVERLAARFRLRLASSSNRPIIELLLQLSAIADRFEVTVSSEEVARGSRPRICGSRRCGGWRSRPRGRRDRGFDERTPAARAAGMFVIAVPNPALATPLDALAAADVALDSLAELRPETVLGF